MVEQWTRHTDAFNGGSEEVLLIKEQQEQVTPQLVHHKEIMEVDQDQDHLQQEMVGRTLVAGGNATPSPGGGTGGNGANIGTNFFGPTAPSYGTPGTNPGRYFAGWRCYRLRRIRAIGSGGEGGGATSSNAGQAGTANTGGGGSEVEVVDTPDNGGAGGSGFVAIRYKFQ